jgi:hypothetical protein
MQNISEVINTVVINDNDVNDPSGVMAFLDQQDMFAREDAIQIMCSCFPANKPR